MRVSIVTPVLNRADLIEEALASIQSQEGVEVEHIIVDGGSTDGTLDVVARYPHLYVINLPGSGPEQAINEGIRRATGEFIAFVHSDDRLAPGILARAAALFAARPALDIVSSGGGFFTVGADGREIVLRTYCRGPLIDLDYRSVLIGPLMVCARFYRRRVFARIGVFKTEFRYCNDRVFLWQALVAGCVNVCLAEIGYWYRSHPGSNTVGAGRDVARKIAMEHIELARTSLGRLGFSELHRVWLRRFHAVETMRATVLALRDGDFGAAAGAAKRGFEGSPVWALVALRELAMLKWLRFTAQAAKR
jgi:glycosyltransferase involved in cell wall biosynthesis